MSRDAKLRKRARKARNVRDEEAKKRADEAYKEQRRTHPSTDFTRIHHVLLNGSFRSHEKGGYKPFKDYVPGPTVKASDPEELENATNEFYVDAVLGDRDN